LKLGSFSLNFDYKVEDCRCRDRDRGRLISGDWNVLSERREPLSVVSFLHPLETRVPVSLKIQLFVGI